ncbi:MAG: hypothetical protein JSV33_01175 [bacterium]|nr:MAG: hypothetical protein JSV33_01175 [bacterium]
MSLKRDLHLPILVLILLSIGGLLLHLRLHPVSFDSGRGENPANVIPFISALLGAVAVPILLSSARTFVIGYLINGMAVVIGTITMAHMSIAAPPYPVTISGILMNTSIPYIILLIPKLLIGQRIMFFYHPNGMGRFFTAWWWLRHFAYLSGIYTLGHLLWR